MCVNYWRKKTSQFASLPLFVNRRRRERDRERQNQTAKTKRTLKAIHSLRFGFCLLLCGFSERSFLFHEQFSFSLSLYNSLYTQTLELIDTQRLRCRANKLRKWTDNSQLIFRKCHCLWTAYSLCVVCGLFSNRFFVCVSMSDSNQTIERGKWWVRDRLIYSNLCLCMRELMESFTVWSSLSMFECVCAWKFHIIQKRLNRVREREKRSKSDRGRETTLFMP